MAKYVEYEAMTTDALMKERDENQKILDATPREEFGAATAAREKEIKIINDIIATRLAAVTPVVTNVHEILNVGISDPAPPTSDAVNHPSHYNWHPSGVECITVSEAFPHNIAAAIEYLWRAHHKGALAQDLDKALWYIAREKDRCKRMGLI